MISSSRAWARARSVAWRSRVRRASSSATARVCSAARTASRRSASATANSAPRSGAASGRWVRTGPRFICAGRSSLVTCSARARVRAIRSSRNSGLCFPWRRSIGKHTDQEAALFRALTHPKESVDWPRVTQTEQHGGAQGRPPTVALPDVRTRTCRCRGPRPRWEVVLQVPRELPSPGRWASVPATPLLRTEGDRTPSRVTKEPCTTTMASSRYRGLDDEYPGLVASRNTVIVRPLGMVTWRERFRRPAYRTLSFEDRFPEEVVAMARGGQRRRRRPSDRRDRRAGTTRRQQLHPAARPRPLRRRRPLGGRLLRLCRSPGPELFVRLGMTPAEAIVTRHVSGGTGVRADREREH